MANRFFLDTNTLLYLLSHEHSKANKVEQLLKKVPVISVQVLNEFVAAARRKYRTDWSIIETALQPIRAACEIVPLSTAIHDAAITIAKSAKIGIYDANIVAAAELSGCNVLYTEDMNHGQRIGRVDIVNPFAAA